MIILCLNTSVSASEFAQIKQIKWILWFCWNAFTRYKLRSIKWDGRIAKRSPKFLFLCFIFP